MKHINVALFVPDLGCPHRCSFCNQKTISGKQNPINAADIEKAVETALSTADCNEGEIAFFGGSFTAIDRGYMLELLKKAEEYVSKGLFRGIRISTRPDCINEEILEILRSYGVSSIELGCQSMDDEVLRMNNRGHTSDCVTEAAELIKSYGFELGVQMMTGLYGDTREKSLETARKLISLKPDTARIYPTVVLEGTELERLYRNGKYTPQSIEEATELCSELLMMFNDSGIRVIRLGLHSGGNVEEGFVAGVYHPAFRELCESRIYLKLTEKELEIQKLSGGEIEITVGSRYVSMLAGQKKSNVKYLQAKGYKVRIVQDDGYPKYKITVRGIKNDIKST
ncbi:MAG: radical SAM protein [Clostridia bacterium]|nr:radical SAM protein [Clostridia bacterium]